MEVRLYRWQELCLKAWKDNSYRGIAHVTTGAGKTVLAIEGAKQLNYEKSDNLRVYIIVPKTALKEQWRNSLINRGVNDVIIWRTTQRVCKKYTIFTINTAREILSLLVERDMKEGHEVLLILDEVHHYGSPANSHIYDFFHSKYYKPELYYSLGLTATNQTKYWSSVITPHVGPIIFDYTLNNALDESIINDFIIFNVSVSFDEEDREVYLIISNSIKICLSRIFKRFPHLPKLRLPFYETLSFLRNHDAESMADSLEALVRERRDLIIKCDKRVEAAIKIIQATSGKTIVFSERIEQVEAIKEKLTSLNVKALVYQSLMDREQKERSLNDFKDNMARVLICCKALDEGLDVPDCDIAIVLSSTATKLQRVQRIGRIVRKAPNKLPSTLYYIHVEDTVEDSDYLKEISQNGKTPIVDITYINNQMFDPYYVESVYKLLKENDFSALSDKEKIKLKELIKLGTIRMERFLDQERLKKLIDEKRGNTALFKLFLLMKKKQK